MRNSRVAQLETSASSPTGSMYRNEKRQDDAIIRASLFYGAAMLLLVLLQYLIFETYSALPFFCLFAFFVHLTWIRRSVSDPFSILLLFAFIYSAFPLLFGQPRSQSSLTFGFDGAAIIYAVGSISLVFGVGVAIALLPGQSSSLKRARQRFHGRVPPIVALGASLLSLALTAMYAARNGSVLGGDMSYGDSFEVKQTAGAGLFMLSVPLAAAAYASSLRLKTGLALISMLLFWPPIFSSSLLTGSGNFLSFLPFSIRPDISEFRVGPNCSLGYWPVL